MTAPDSECPETWLARRLAVGKPAETWKAMAPIDGCVFSYYEVTDTGARRSLDRPGNGRVRPGGPLTVRTRRDGYIHADFYCDDKTACRKNGRHTLTMHTVVLTTFAGPCPPGMEGSHLYGNPAHNWWPEGLAFEDKPANEQRKTSRPPPPAPAFPCRNAPDGCTGKALNEGRRCAACAVEVQRLAAAMLDGRQLLSEVAAHFQLTEGWIYEQAVKGGYQGSVEQARTGRVPLSGWRLKVARRLGAV